MKILIEGSGRHVHLSKEHLEALFGEGFELTVKNTLSQPGQYASTSRVTLTGPKGTESLAVLGPCRKVTQVELSLTSARALGLNCPIRESGNIAGSAPCTLTGPNGKVELKEGVIIAKRHIHLTPEDSANYGVTDGEIVQVKVDGERALIFDEVVCRVDPSYAASMHVDYDEINAAGLDDKHNTGEIVKK